jgi:hypothetical protein
MLRRIASSLRITLLIAGVIFLLSIPVSFDAPARYVIGYGYGDNIGLHFEDGAVLVVVPSLYGPIGFTRGDSYVLEGNALRPVTDEFYTQHRGVVRIISFPLWLLAFLCLAWPVTSFVIARRRRGTRGFEVEAKRKDEG